ncbi:phosphatidylinositol- -trisphosphate 3 [Cystoisospora suis]|uniref:Phosphatidylinositol--trisphosphate 3 n=1 Tax=Cystoisospora suis TaxID=483139 RepID=A0A2C6L5H0_9APIC|nr:phosphatidylinositol- -trisphosphate 3 [Cystoisospora suis]
MGFLAAVRNLTSSAQEALLQTVAKPADESPCRRSSATENQYDRPPLLVPHRPKELSAVPALVENGAAPSAASCGSGSCTDRPVQGGVQPAALQTSGFSERRACGRLTSSGASGAAGAVDGEGTGASRCSTGVTSTSGSPAAPGSPSGLVFSDAATAESGSLSSIVASFAAAAAQSLMDTIEQSSQQLFRPPGMFPVTNNVWMMEYPDPEAVNTGLVVAYLERHHANKYLILNMSERQYQQLPLSRAEVPCSSSVSSARDNPAKQSSGEPLFPTGTVIDVAYRGLPYPPLSLTLSLIMSVHKWLESDSDSILLVHCFKGFSRSITFLAAYLHWAGIASSLQEAVRTLERACGVDTTDPLVLLPSQKRFLRFFQQTCVKASIYPQFATKKLLRVLLNGVPSFSDPRPPAVVSAQQPHSPPARAVEAESGLFRPILEVWYQGQLAFSSLEHFLPAPIEEVARPEYSNRLSVCEGTRVPLEAFKRLPVYSVSDGSVRFDVPGIPLAGDVLLRLLHVAPQYASADAHHTSRDDGRTAGECFGSEGEFEPVVLTHGRKISTARVAFHTDMTKEGGYLEVRKEGMDGAVVLPSFPDDCFLSVFFEEQVRDDGVPKEEDLTRCEDSRLLLQARKEGVAVRAVRQRRAEEQRAAEEAVGNEMDANCSAVEEEHQQKAQKRLELREQVLAYKEMAERWRLAGGGAPHSGDSNVSSLRVGPPSPHAVAVKHTAGLGSCQAPEEPMNPGAPGVLQARLTDGESEDDHEPADFVASFNGEMPDLGAEVKTGGAEEVVTALPNTPDIPVAQKTALGGNPRREFAVDKLQLTSDPFSAMCIVQKQLLNEEDGSEDGGESESDVSWGKDDVEEPGDGDASVHTAPLADSSTGTEIQRMELGSSTQGQSRSPRRDAVAKGDMFDLNQGLKGVAATEGFEHTEVLDREAILVCKENTCRQPAEQYPQYEQATNITAALCVPGRSNPRRGAEEPATLSQSNATAVCAVRELAARSGTTTGKRQDGEAVVELNQRSSCETGHCHSQFLSQANQTASPADFTPTALGMVGRCNVSVCDAPLSPALCTLRSILGAAGAAASAVEGVLPHSLTADRVSGANEPSAVSSGKGSSEWTALASQSSSPVLVSSPGTPGSDGSSHLTSPQSEQDHPAEAIDPGESELVGFSGSHSSPSVGGASQSRLICVSESPRERRSRLRLCGELDQESNRDRTVVPVRAGQGGLSATTPVLQERAATRGADSAECPGFKDEIPQLQAWQPKADCRGPNSVERGDGGADVPQLQELE